MSYFFTSHKVSLLCISFLLWADAYLHLYFLPDFGLVLFSLVHFGSRWYLCSPRKAHELCAPPGLWEVSPALKNWSCCLYRFFLWNVFEILTSADMKLQQTTFTFGMCVPQLFKSAHLTGHPSGALLMDRAPSLLRLCTNLRTRSKSASEYIYMQWCCWRLYIILEIDLVLDFFSPPELMMLIVCTALQQRLATICCSSFFPCIYFCCIHVIGPPVVHLDNSKHNLFSFLIYCSHYVNTLRCESYIMKANSYDCSVQHLHQMTAQNGQLFYQLDVRDNFTLCDGSGAKWDWTIFRMPTSHSLHFHPG